VTPAFSLSRESCRWPTPRRFERRLELVLAMNATTIVVDLAGVEFIDSTGLSVLVRAQQQASERGIGLGVANPNAQAARCSA